ncbi:H-NS family nucleoid-associated regulatory protein [Caballeronia glebae]|uniref:H-NS family nucleoid-associated regulatory protein n=1 Tax=Caballeronia glebae TaxID=1777143 RepID=UPI0038BD557A
MTTLEQIQARVKNLQAQAEAIVVKSAQAAVDQIRELMLKHGLTTADIEARAEVKRDAKTDGRTTVSRSVKTSSPSNGKLPAKYLNPKTGETWSGHARPPAWIKDVKDRTRFLIDGAGTASSAKTVSASSGKTPVRKVQSKGALPAKYRDPKSGATWSGRGPAPKWLASAKDRNKFLIEQALDGRSDAAAMGSATKSKTPRNVSAVSKKVGAKKTAAATKKAVVARKAAAKASAKAVNAKRASARKAAARELSTSTATTMLAPEATSTASA